MTEGVDPSQLKDPQPEPPAGRGARIALIAIPIGTGLLVLVGTYLVGCGIPWAHLVLAGGTLAMGFAARAWLGPGRGAAIAFTMAVLLPLLLLSAFEAANVPILSELTAYQRLSTVFKSGRLAIVSGGATCALLMTVLSLRRRPGAVGRAIWIAMVAATVALGALTLLGADRVLTRPSSQDFRATIREVVTLRTPRVDETCLYSHCRDVLFEDESAVLSRACRKAHECRLSLDLRDGIGAREIYTRLAPGAPIVLRANRDYGIWVVQLPTEDAKGGAVDHVVGVRPRSAIVRAATLRSAIAPERISVGFMGLGAVLAAAGSTWLLIRRRKRDALESAREAEMDDDGWINLGGETAELRRAEGEHRQAGPVLVAADKALDTYREAAAPPLRVLAWETKAQVFRRLAVDARDVSAIVLAAAAHLAVPLVAEALAGRLF